MAIFLPSTIGVGFAAKSRAEAREVGQPSQQCRPARISKHFGVSRDLKGVRSACCLTSEKAALYDCAIPCVKENGCASSRGWLLAPQSVPFALVGAFFTYLSNQRSIS
jgi:hypothetical protein